MSVPQKAFVSGAKDPAAIDELLVLVDLFDRLQVPHVRVLAVLYSRRAGGSETAVRLPEFRAHDPALGNVVIPLARQLEAEGLVNYRKAEPQTYWIVELTQLGSYVVDLLNSIGAGLTAKDFSR